MNLKSMIEAIEENNKMHDATWNDWQGDSAACPEEVYGKFDGDYSDVERSFLCALIRDGGENKDIYLNAMSALEFGVVYN